MEKKIEATLILVLGPQGSGKEMFGKCFKNSFLRTFPFLSLEEGVRKKVSFCFFSDLQKPREIEFIQKAKEKGFKTIGYCLFASRLLCQERNRFKCLAKGEMWNPVSSRDEYERFYASLLEIYPFFDVVFFVENQKYFRFVGVYSVDSVPISSFEKSLRREKGICDKISKI